MLSVGGADLGGLRSEEKCSFVHSKGALYTKRGERFVCRLLCHYVIFCVKGEIQEPYCYTIYCWCHVVEVSVLKHIATCTRPVDSHTAPPTQESKKKSDIDWWR